MEKGASITAPDNYGRTALHRAVIPNEQQIVMELFQLPINEILTRDDNGMTPFHLAALDNESGHCVLNIMMHVSDASATGAAFIPDNRGFSPLHYAAFKGNTDFTEQ
jgi:ankyrin repeat protein